MVFNNIQILLGPITRAISEMISRYQDHVNAVHVLAVSRGELRFHYHYQYSLGVTVDGFRRLNMRQLKEILAVIRILRELL